VFDPFGSTVALSVTDVVVIVLAAKVVTAGDNPVVVKFQAVDQLLSPTAFFAFTLQ
jgi:hypothetical protein